jgi:hypothetical protein
MRFHSNISDVDVPASRANFARLGKDLEQKTPAGERQIIENINHQLEVVAAWIPHPLVVLALYYSIQPDVYVA